MKKIIFVTKKEKLKFNDKDITINEIDIENIINEYSDEYIIDLQNHIATIVGNELIVSFKLIEKKPQ